MKALRTAPGIRIAAMRAAAVGLLGVAALLCAAPLNEVSPAELLAALSAASRLESPPYVAGSLALGASVPR